VPPAWFQPTRRAISAAVGGSVSKEIAVSRTYGAQICVQRSASAAPASLITTSASRRPRSAASAVPSRRPDVPPILKGHLQDTRRAADPQLTASYRTDGGCSVGRMDDDLRQWLFDPADAHRLVLARRPSAPSPLTCVISDVVWQEVVHLLRWSAASTDDPGTDAGRWWRLAAACADLLRRLPALCDELGEPWCPTGAADDPGLRGTDRVARVTGRLAALLRSSDPLPLHRLARDVDALGAAAISALAETSSWALPAR
jgi:hypothetical protein